MTRVGQFDDNFPTVFVSDSPCFMWSWMLRRASHASREWEEVRPLALLRRLNKDSRERRETTCQNKQSKWRRLRRFLVHYEARSVRPPLWAQNGKAFKSSFHSGVCVCVTFLKRDSRGLRTAWAGRSVGYYACWLRPLRRPRPTGYPSSW